MIQWNLYKATTKFSGLSIEVVSHDRKKKHDFVKTANDEIYAFLIRLSRYHYTGIHNEVPLLFRQRNTLLTRQQLPFWPELAIIANYSKFI